MRNKKEASLLRIKLLGVEGVHKDWLINFFCVKELNKYEEINILEGKGIPIKSPSTVEMIMY